MQYLMQYLLLLRIVLNHQHLSLILNTACSHGAAALAKELARNDNIKARLARGKDFFNYQNKPLLSMMYSFVHIGCWYGKT